MPGSFDIGNLTAWTKGNAGSRCNFGPQPLLCILSSQRSNGALIGDVGPLKGLELHCSHTQHANGQHQKRDERLD